MKKLILISGKARCGKDSASEYIIKNTEGVCHMDITGQLKSELAHLIGKDVEWIDENKDVALFEGSTVRSMLQRFGNDIIKKILFKDYWLQERLARVNECKADTIIISGIRMVREVEYFQKNFCGDDKKVISLKLSRLNDDGTVFEGLSGEDRFHITETDVDRIDPDFYIEAKNLEELYVGLDKFMDNNK